MVTTSSTNTPVCFAPWISLNFDRFGNVTPCCYNRAVKYGNVNETSLMEIFKNKKTSNLKEKILKGDFSYGCQLCGIQIEKGQQNSALLNNFNNISDLYNNGWPSIFEFEMHNACNLHCTMCSGEYSSIIRRDLEKREVLPFVYTDKFLDELKPFIPHLKMCRFLGGEPFMISFYFKILKLLEEHNPLCKAFFTSNINFIPEKGWYFLAKLKNFNIIGSIDSLQKENYEKIRLGGNFDNMYKNLTKLIELKKITTITINPLIHNFYELGDILPFAQKYNLTLFFNNTIDFLSGHKEGVHYKDGKPLYERLFIHQLSENEFNQGIFKLNDTKLKDYYSKKREELIKLLQNIFKHKIKALHAE